MVRTSSEEILAKYSRKLSEGGGDFQNYGEEDSREFLQFKQEMMPQLSRYERLCKNIGGMLKLKIAKKDYDKLQKSIEAARLDVTPSQTLALGVLSFIGFLLTGIMITAAIFLLTNTFSFLLLLLFLFTASFLFYYFYSMPERLANKWRLQAGSQFVPCVLYTVIYMKHTSNLERAIRFASQHLEPPLALDLKKVFWDVETGKYSTIKESLDNYLEGWRTTNSEFVESFNLIESSLFEPSEARRIEILERALQVILDGVYDKMLKYT